MRSLRQNQQGVTLLETLAATALGFLFYVIIVQSLQFSGRQERDFEIAARTMERSRTVLDYITYDLRMIGSGVPFMQSGFQIGDPILSTAPYPILLNATATHIELRMNERGINTVTTADYTPSATDLTISVLSTSDLLIGDEIYLSDHTRGGSSGLRGTVTGLTTNTVTVDPTYHATSAATLQAGSIVHRVTTVVYDSPADGSGITRSARGITTVVEPGSAFALTFYNTSGTTIVLPLTAAIMKTDLASLGITVTVAGRSNLSNGASYSTSASDEVALRNIVLSR